jgi:hypothetical protein
VRRLQAEQGRHPAQGDHVLDDGHPQVLGGDPLHRKSQQPEALRAPGRDGIRIVDEQAAVGELLDVDLVRFLVEAEQHVGRIAAGMQRL